MNAYLLTTNNFGEPTVLKDNDARGMLLINLILFTPGHNPLFPRMGCGLLAKRHMMESELPGEQRNIAKQIQTYLPECLFDSVELSKNDDNYLVITINCEDNVKYVFDTEKYGNGVTLSDVLGS